MINQTKVIFFLLAGLFSVLFLIFVYYLYAEKFVRNQEEAGYLYKPDLLAPENNPNLNTSTSISTGSVGDKDNQDQSPGFDTEVTKAPKKQVFSISENKYTYPEAQALCKVFDSELATLEQLMDAYRKGADWCSYGWVNGQMAFYPTQKETWEKLQKNTDPDKRKQCGKPGLNGGYFNDPNLRFGVVCYGVKPEPRPHEKIKQALVTDADMELQRMIDGFKEDVDNITILPFNREKWGSCKK